MKKYKLILLIAAMVSLAGRGFGQSISPDNVPEEVLSSFRAKFPAATNVSWVIETNMNYEASFLLATISQRAEFDKNGIWVETENSINKAELPKKVSHAVLTKNPSCNIVDAEEIQSADLGKMYEVGCAAKKGKSDYRVTSDGKIIASLGSKY